MSKFKKSWRKWALALPLVAIAVTVLSLSGCSAGKPSTNTSLPAKPLTPIEQINVNVSTLTARVVSLDNSFTALSGLPSSMATINTVIAGLTSRIAALEALSVPAMNLSELNASFSALNANISMLALRITAIETRLAPTPTPTPTPTPNGSATPTPTPVPTVTPCVVQKPVVVSPVNGAIDVAAGSVMFQWATCTGADHYEFWFGTDSGSMTLRTNVSAPVHFYSFPAPTANTYYYWKVVAVSSCGSKDMDAWWFKTSP